MSMMLASGQIRNITPRQTAGAAGPKSVRNVMTGRIGGWYQGPRRAEAAPGGGSAPLRRWSIARAGGGSHPRDREVFGSVRSGCASVRGAEATGADHGFQE